MNRSFLALNRPIKANMAPIFSKAAAIFFWLSYIAALVARNHQSAGIFAIMAALCWIFGKSWTHRATTPSASKRASEDGGLPAVISGSARPLSSIGVGGVGAPRGPNAAS